MRLRDEVVAQPWTLAQYKSFKPDVVPHTLSSASKLRKDPAGWCASAEHISRGMMLGLAETATASLCRLGMQ